MIQRDKKTKNLGTSGERERERAWEIPKAISKKGDS